MRALVSVDLPAPGEPVSPMVWARPLARERRARSTAAASSPPCSTMVSSRASAARSPPRPPSRSSAGSEDRSRGTAANTTSADPAARRSWPDAARSVGPSRPRTACHLGRDRLDRQLSSCTDSAAAESYRSAAAGECAADVVQVGGPARSGGRSDTGSAPLDHRGDGGCVLDRGGARGGGPSRASSANDTADLDELRDDLTLLDLTGPPRRRAAGGHASQHRHRGPGRTGPAQLAEGALDAVRPPPTTSRASRWPSCCSATSPGGRATPSARPSGGTRPPTCPIAEATPAELAPFRVVIDLFDRGAYTHTVPQAHQAYAVAMVEGSTRRRGQRHVDRRPGDDRHRPARPGAGHAAAGPGPLLRGRAREPRRAVAARAARPQRDRGPAGRASTRRSRTTPRPGSCRRGSSGPVCSRWRGPCRPSTCPTSPSCPGRSSRRWPRPRRRSRCSAPRSPTRSCSSSSSGPWPRPSWPSGEPDQALETGRPAAPTTAPNPLMRAKALMLGRRGPGASSASPTWPPRRSTRRSRPSSSDGVDLWSVEALLELADVRAEGASEALEQAYRVTHDDPAFARLWARRPPLVLDVGPGRRPQFRSGDERAPTRHHRRRAGRHRDPGRRDRGALGDGRRATSGPTRTARPASRAASPASPRWCASGSAPRRGASAGTARASRSSCSTAIGSSPRDPWGSARRSWGRAGPYGDAWRTLGMGRCHGSVVPSVNAGQPGWAQRRATRTGGPCPTSS